MIELQKCPACGSDDIDYKRKARTWECQSCRAAFDENGLPKKPENAAALPQFPGLDLASMPSVLAVPLADYLSPFGGSAKLKLWAACDAVEIGLRLCVFIGLADLKMSDGLPEDLLLLFSEKIERPTLGTWKVMAQKLAEYRLQTVPGVGDWVTKALIPLIDTKKGRRRSERTSFSELRNHLAHGGGMTEALAGDLVAAWKGPFEEAMAGAAWLANTEFVGKTKDGWRSLRGVTGGAEWEPPSTELRTALESAPLNESGVFAVHGRSMLPLWPLAVFGTPSGGSKPLAQVYSRRDDRRLHYTPVGSTEVCRGESDDKALQEFLKLFQFEEFRAKGRDEAVGKTAAVGGFEDDFRSDSDRLIGRVEELEQVRKALSEKARGGVLWLEGRAGIGKSFLTARIATELLDSPPDRNTLVLPYRFKAGDGRCSRSAFLRLALDRLDAWIPTNKDKPAGKDAGPLDQEKSRGSKQAFAKDEERISDQDKLREKLESLPEGRRIVFILDGLDEIALFDPLFVKDVPLTFQLPGVTWLCAGRPEQGLTDAFNPEQRVFAEGLGDMKDDDIWAMLLDDEDLRRRLVRKDEEKEGLVTNPFVAQVARNAGGLPLYVKLVVDDFLEGRINRLDGSDDLPPSLAAYLDTLIARLGIGDLQTIVSPIAAALAVAYEPLGEKALADLVAATVLKVKGDKAASLVRKALSAIASMVKPAATPEGEKGYTLYHLSIRQRILGSEKMQGNIEMMRGILAEKALSPAGEAANYLYRQGVRHLLFSDEHERSLRDGGQKETLSLLTDFSYLMSRLQALGDPEGPKGLTEDWRRLRSTDFSLDRSAMIWESFFREKAHILRRGDKHWPSYKILLQLVVEHADDSPLTLQAERWLEEGHCDWTWLRNSRRVTHARVSPCLAVLEGHTGEVRGALPLQNQRILSWADDRTPCIWSIEGDLISVLKGHTDIIVGALLFNDNRILTWSSDNTLRIWSREGNPITVLKGHTGEILGALIFPDGRILSWSWDNTMRIWSGQGDSLAVLEGHENRVLGAMLFPDSRILSWSSDNTLRIWSREGNPIAVLKDHTGEILGALIFPDGRILSWSWDNTMRIWSGQGDLLAVLEGHTNRVLGSLLFPDGRILSWSENTLTIWSGEGNSLVVLRGHTGWIEGATLFPDGRILSWSWGALRIWSGQGDLLAVLEGHTNRLLGSLLFPDGRILSWSDDKTLRIWSRKGVKATVFEGHADPILGAFLFSDNHIVSWSSDKTIRVWSNIFSDDIQSNVLEGHSEKVIGALPFPDGRILSWSWDNTMRIWSPQGDPLAVLEGHTSNINGALLFPDNRILSWSDDGTLRIWSEEGNPSAILIGHTSGILGALVCPDGRILSWSWDSTLRIWSELGVPLVILKGHTNKVIGTSLFPNGRILSWSWDRTLRIWSDDGSPISILKEHTDEILGALIFSDDRILSWSLDNTLRIWSAQGELLKVVPDARMKNGLLFSDGRLLSWSSISLRTWSKEGILLTEYVEPANLIENAFLFSDGRILLQSSGNALRICSNEGRLFEEFSYSEIPWEYLRANLMTKDFLNFIRSSNFRYYYWAGTKWHSESGVTPYFLFDDGRAVVALDSGQLYVLQLHHGDDPISVEKAGRLEKEEIFRKIL